LGSGEERRLSFEGLLVEVTLPRELRGTTAVLAVADAVIDMDQAARVTAADIPSRSTSDA
jgi:hypothetical protein